MKVSHERIEEAAPPEVAGYEVDEDYRLDVYTFDFGDEVYGAQVVDSDRTAAYVLKRTSGPDNDERLAEIKTYLVEQAQIRSLYAIDPRKGYYAKWPWRKGFRRR